MEKPLKLVANANGIHFVQDLSGYNHGIVNPRPLNIADLRTQLAACRTPRELRGMGQALIDELERLI